MVKVNGGANLPIPKETAAGEAAPLLWAFVQKVYALVALQVALSSGIAAAASNVTGILSFFRAPSELASVLAMAAPLLILLVMCPLRKYKKSFPLNAVLMAIFTICKSFAAIVIASGLNGEFVLLSLILIAVLFVSLALYACWAQYRSYDFSLRFMFMLAISVVVVVYVAIQVFFPLGKVEATIYACLATAFYGWLIAESTKMLLEEHSCDEYMEAAISLYTDVNI